MRSLAYDVQAHLADRVPDAELFTEKGVERILTVIEARAELRSGDERRRCLEALFEFERQRTRGGKRSSAERPATVWLSQKKPKANSSWKEPGWSHRGSRTSRR